MAAPGDASFSPSPSLFIRIIGRPRNSQLQQSIKHTSREDKCAHERTQRGLQAHSYRQCGIWDYTKTNFQKCYCKSLLTTYLHICTLRYHDIILQIYNTNKHRKGQRDERKWIQEWVHTRRDKSQISTPRAESWTQWNFKQCAIVYALVSSLLSWHNYTCVQNSAFCLKSKIF